MCNVTTALGVLTSAGHLAPGETVVVLDSVGGSFRSSVTGLLAAFGRPVVFGNAATEDVTFEGTHPGYTNSSPAGYNLGGVACRAPQLLRAHMEQALAEVAKERGNSPRPGP
ncbi:hypothetical protein ACPXCS_04710 [Streptomyces sp. DT190]|uniref:hypothetical protein n=1 Tax=unclassified Streptomyces TaxID=2593676 RepID=UPI003CF8D766